MYNSRRGAPLPPRAPERIAKTLKYSEAQEHLLRRLGAALVLQWDALTDDQQDLLLDQATIVEDRDPAPHESIDVENFIRGAKAVALQPAPAAESDAS
jgi:hypothetical protein